MILGWLNQLTARGKFRTATLAHARVGHTHGPLGILSLCPICFVWSGYRVFVSLGLGPRNIYIYICYDLDSNPLPSKIQCFGLLAASFKYVDVLSDMTDASMPHALKPKYFVLFI